MLKYSKIFLILISTTFFTFAKADRIKNIEISGNKRISEETIKMFADFQINNEINDQILNEILKNLYESNFFENVIVEYNQNTLFINVEELPIVQNIVLDGIKANKFKDEIKKNFKLKSRSSFNEYFIKEDKKIIETILKKNGYYFSTIDTYVENIENNMVNINYKINLGGKAKIKKITFVGNKIFKDKVLKNLIISEEFKFWKFISSKKYLNEDLIRIDKNLLKSFYLNKGFYNVEINSSFARLLNKDEFEIIYNISPNEKIYFGDLSIIFPNDFNENNYEDLINSLNDLKGNQYSINSVEKILNEIDLITINEEFKSIKSTVEEEIVNNVLNIKFVIEDIDRTFVEQINILGNNITEESVIRNQLILDEGDPYNEILMKRSENNIKSLNFFKEVKLSSTDGKNKNNKIINIEVDEKPTGEISAGAGIGSSGGTVMFGVKENNYLGRGLSVNANATVSSETFKGLFSVTNPNFNNSDKSVFASIQALEIDKLKNYGFKTNKTGGEFGTKFEYLKNFNLGLSFSTFYEKIETDSTASARQKKQEGDYVDIFTNLEFAYDKRNQKYRTTRGFLSNYEIQIPLISKTNTLTNSYSYKLYGELYENNVSSVSLFLKTANSITGDDVKLSERITIPSRRLRGFEGGKVGPKDGNDFIGGNYITTLNINTTLPQILPSAENVDISLFFDAANIWGVDYDSSINDSSKLRSSIGIGVDWFTVVGPLTFSLTEVITKDDNDVEESFRFNLGTTF